MGVISPMQHVLSPVDHLLHYRSTCFPQKYRHVEILGFTDECKLQFAEKAFEEEPETLARFKNFIFANPVITSLMYMPVNCAIIAQVYKDLHGIAVPKTMTQLYTLLVLVLIRRHLIPTGRWTMKSRVPNNLNALPEDIKTDLMKVSEIAYKGLMKKDVQIMFTDEDIGENFQHLGLLNETKEMYILGAVTYYSFPHLSVQEFLAAWYVSNDLSLIRHCTSSIERLVFLDPHLRVFGKFLSSYSLVVIKELIRLRRYDSYTISCCYKAQDMSCFKNAKYCSIDLKNSLDMYIFGYALVHAPIQWCLHKVTASFDMLESSIADHAPDGKIKSQES